CGWDGETPSSSPQPAMHRLRFRGFRYQEAEGPREAYDHLCLLSRVWLRPEQRSKEQMLDLLVLEQFLSILPQEIQSWVGGCHPQTGEQAVALVEGFQLAKEEPGIWPQQEVIYGCEIIREWDMGPFPSRGRQLQSTHEVGGTGWLKGVGEWDTGPFTLGRGGAGSDLAPGQGTGWPRKWRMGSTLGRDPTDVPNVGKASLRNRTWFNT
uniref:SCAN box domain-containing protein n=1 Tax=Chrysemys picta bellii TaxID=8478 RepID=A0A8C3FJD1_CHRPI